MHICYEFWVVNKCKPIITAFIVYEIYYNKWWNYFHTNQDLLRFSSTSLFNFHCTSWMKEQAHTCQRKLGCIGIRWFYLSQCQASISVLAEFRYQIIAFRSLSNMTEKYFHRKHLFLDTNYSMLRLRGTPSPSSGELL